MVSKHYFLLTFLTSNNRNDDEKKYLFLHPDQDIRTPITFFQKSTHRPKVPPDGQSKVSFLKTWTFPVIDQFLSLYARTFLFLGNSVSTFCYCRKFLFCPIMLYLPHPSFSHSANMGIPLHSSPINGLFTGLILFPLLEISNWLLQRSFILLLQLPHKVRPSN